MSESGDVAAGSATAATSGAHISVCLSGGGHRASLFGLGALLYLVDAGKGPEIASIASISGGSLTNGYVGLHSDLSGATDDAAQRRFWAEVTPLARTVATGGTVWASWRTYLYLLTLAAVLAAATWLCFPLGTWASVGVWVVALVLFGWLATRRSAVARASFDAKLFHGRRLTDMRPGVDHVIAAADLQTAEQVYFSRRFVYSYRLGWGAPKDLEVAWAAQASACLPGAFAPVTKRASAFGFQHSRTETPNRVLLVDGGVYDNMGTQWPLNVDQRLRATGAPTPPPVIPDEVIVVNASAAMGVERRRTARWPLIGEITSLLADKDMLYDQTTAVRRRLLFARFRATRRGTPEPPAMNGVIAQIDRSPLDLAGSFAGGTDAAADRARKVVAQLSGLADWDAEAKANAAVKTTLSRIQADRAAGLLRHAYALVMADTCVLLGYPLLDLPPLERFRELVKRS